MVFKPGPSLPRLLGSTWRFYSQNGLRLAQAPHARQCRASSSVISQQEAAPHAHQLLTWSMFSNSTPAIINEFRQSPGSRWEEMLSTSGTPLLVILLTPGHISLLDKVDESIGFHLLTVCPKADSKERHVNVLIAVVDRIPLVKKHVPRQAPFLRDVPNRGSEGMSVAYLDSDHAAPDLWLPRKVSNERDTMTIQQRCSISFAFRHPHSAQTLQSFQLPVANTLFLNGKTSTLLAQRWVQQPFEAGKESYPFKLVEENALPEQVINMIGMPPAGHTVAKEVQNFLERITEPRTVAVSVGNIIQKIYLGDGLEASPASQELESAIHKRIQDGEMPSHHADIWALIAPKGARVHNTVLQKDILKGCRICKVLSGGGGWGVKQGLLSLDPDSDYNSLLERYPAHVLPALQDGENGSTRMFEDIVNPGDTVTFFVNSIREGPIAELMSADDVPDICSQTPRRQLLQFGTIPSTIDAPRAAVDDASNVKIPRKAVSIKDCFGMLSEQGMSFQYEDISETQKPTRKTKLDAPYFLYLLQSITASDPQDSQKLGEEDRQDLEAITAKFLAAKQAAKDTLAALETNFKIKKQAAAEWLTRRGQDALASRLVAPSISDQGRQSHINKRGTAKGGPLNPNNKLVRTRPLIRFQPVYSPQPVSQKRHQTPPVHTSKDSDYQKSDTVIVRKFLKNDKTDAKVKRAAAKVVTASSRMRPAGNSTNISAFLPKQPSDENSVQ